MQTINLHEAQTYLSRLVEQAAAGEEIVIAKAGKPLAWLVPYAPTASTASARDVQGGDRYPGRFRRPPG